MSRNPVQGPETKYGWLRLAMPPFALMGTMVVVAIVGGKPAGPGVVGFDKVAHFFIFGLIGTLLFRRLRIEFWHPKRWIYAYLGIVAFGVLDECLQIFNPNRSFDPYDWLADLTGAALAIYVYRSWSWYRNLLEFPLWGRLAKARPGNSNAGQ